MSDTVSVTHALCPHCRSVAATVDHCQADWFPPWYCKKCGGGYQARRGPTGIEIRKAQENGKDLAVWPFYWVLLRRGDTVMLAKNQRCPTWDDDHDEYFYNEHTCPTNWLRDVEELACAGEIDPHGGFQFVKTWPAKDDDDPRELLAAFLEGNA